MAAFAVASLVVVGCARAGGASLAAPLASGTLDVQKDGVELQVRLTQSTVAPGAAADIDVTFTNHRDVPLMYDSTGCFAHVEITAGLPLEPTGKTWTGPEARFKSFALSHGLGPGGVRATDPMVIQPDPGGCSGAADSDYQTALASGTGLHALVKWPTEYVRGVPILPQAADVHVSVGYDLQNGPPSYPPDYTGIRGSWFPIFKQVDIKTKLAIAGPAPKVVTAGQAIDGALANSTFRRLVDSQPDGACTDVNFFLFDNPAGGYLPAGPQWEIDNICESPRNYVIVAVDPFTGVVTGETDCPVPCNR